MSKEVRFRIIALQAVMVLVFAFCAGFLYWGSGFVNGMIHDQLAAQQIYFPASGSASIKALPAADAAAVQAYAGQQVLTGDQAKVYANSFIGVHLNAVRGQDVLSGERGCAGQPAGSQAGGPGADTLPG
ncbi:MAG: hypothetical protein DLM67_01605 [Candidatus Nephthysia bennettiae]|uniref:Uncharacterized protein n=1 Tax=Candidatus Nephthysia bennettiae TaxID=3127016 RepID=A0A934K6Y5_9BACT|nr:hypothetical protein [Candidatus Dormibacteraeota bacterium]PZS00341.1 MAG: hypothetical protein DLM67_01605 [Candidatus Dormibacteraeota bacterium]